MKTRVHNPTQTDHRRVTPHRIKQSNLSGSRKTASFAFEDNRPEAIAQRRMQALSDTSPRMMAQRKKIERNFGDAVQKRKNDTVLPDQLKAGIETLSGVSMDDVRVHHNSAKPAQFHEQPHTQAKNRRLDENATMMTQSGDFHPPALQRNCRNINAHQGRIKNCHEYVIIRLLATTIGQNEAMKAVIRMRASSPSCEPGTSLHQVWYGANLVHTGAPVDEVSVRHVPEGDILVIGDPMSPTHSMIVESQDNAGTWIRGFNNFNALGTGTHNEDDPDPVNLHGPVPQLWQNLGAQSYWKEDHAFWGPDQIRSVPAAHIRSCARLMM